MIPHGAFDLSILDGDGVGSHFGYDIRWRRKFFGALANMTQYCCIYGIGKRIATAYSPIYRIISLLNLSLEAAWTLTGLSNVMPPLSENCERVFAAPPRGVRRWTDRLLGLVQGALARITIERG
jgi:hypothetical protein